MTVRFFNDGRVRSDRGTDLREGSRLDQDEARLQIEAGTPVVLRSFPRVVDLSRAEALELVPSVRREPQLFDHDAVVYSRGDERVLVITYHH